MTICTKERNKDILCHISPDFAVGVAVPGDPPIVSLTPIGEAVRRLIEDINTHYANAEVDYYTIMPDHIHMIVIIHGGGDGSPGTATPTANIPRVVNNLKGLATRKIGYSIWQKNYYERVIRNQEELDDIRSYIQTNPTRLLSYEE